MFLQLQEVHMRNRIFFLFVILILSAVCFVRQDTGAIIYEHGAKSSDWQLEGY